MPRRKRTNKKIPAKGRLRDLCDQLWSRAVRDDWCDKCAVCDSTKCEAHHLIPRTHAIFRYTLRNGIGLCSRCHQFDRDISPHQNAAGWMRWLEHNHLGLCAWYYRNCNPPERPSKRTAKDYLSIMRELRGHVSEEDFVRIVGVRLAEHLDEGDE